MNLGSTKAKGMYALRSEETFGNIKKILFGCLSSENKVGKLAQYLVLALGLAKQKLLTFSIRSCTNGICVNSFGDDSFNQRQYLTFPLIKSPPPRNGRINFLLSGCFSIN